MGLKNLSVIERCPLLGGNLKKIVTFGTTFCPLFKACPLLGGFTASLLLNYNNLSGLFGRKKDESDFSRKKRITHCVQRHAVLNKTLLFHE